MGSNKPVLQAVSGIGINWISAVFFFLSCNTHAMHEVPVHDLQVGVRCSACTETHRALVFFEDTRCINSDTVSWRIYIRKNARLLREGENRGSHSKLPGECPGRDIRRMVGNSWIMASTKCRFEFMRLFFVGVTERSSFVNCQYYYKNCKTTTEEKLRVSISRRVPSRVEKYFRKLEVGVSKHFVSCMLNGILGEERTQKFQADACFLPDEVSVTAVVRDTKGTHCICLSFSYCESDSSRKASRNADIAHTSFLVEQKLSTNIIQNTVSLNAA